MYKVSVIVPAYNAEKTIKRCINSITNQTLKDIEIIIVNDGSTDNTLEIAKELSRHDERIKVINQDNHGTGYAINHGIMSATGEFIAEVDCDDYIETEMYERLYAQSKGMDFVKSGYKVEIDNEVYECPVTKEEITLTPVRLEYGARLNFFGFQPSYWSAIYRRSFIEMYDLFWNETEGASFQDTSVIFRTNALAQKVKLVPECYYHWIRHESEATTNEYNHPYAIIYEYQSIKDFLRKRPELQLPLMNIVVRNEFGAFMWNASRLAKDLKADFLAKAAAVLKSDWEYIDVRLFDEAQIKVLKTMQEIDRLSQDGGQNDKK